MASWNDNYPPGVSGNEPQITGEWPCTQCEGGEECAYCEGKGYVNGDEEWYNFKYKCPKCAGTLEWNDRSDMFQCDSECDPETGQAKHLFEPDEVVCGNYERIEDA